MPGYLYSAASSKYALPFSADQAVTLESILKDFRKICNPSYYSLTGSFDAGAGEKEMVMKKLVLWYRGGNGGEVDQKDIGKFIKRYLKFWEPVLLTLFWCAPIPMELPSATDITLFRRYPDVASDTLEQEFNACLKRRQLSRAFSDSASVRSLMNLSKRTLTLKDAVNLLQQFLDQDEAPKAVLDKFFNQQNQPLIGLWQYCSVSDYIYTRLLVYAQKLVGHAAIGVYYRAVFLKCGMTLN